MRFGDENIAIPPTADFLADGECRTFTNVVDVGFVRQTKAGNAGTLRTVGVKLNCVGAYFFEHVLGHGIVDFPCGTDQPCLFGRRGNDEPWVDCDTVPTHARARLQNTYAWM